MSGITGYDIFYTPNRVTLFGDPAVTDLTSTATTDKFSGQPGCYEVSAVAADGTLSVYNELACTPASGA